MDLIGQCKWNMFKEASHCYQKKGVLIFFQRVLQKKSFICNLQNATFLKPLFELVWWSIHSIISSCSTLVGQYKILRDKNLKKW